MNGFHRDTKYRGFKGKGLWIFFLYIEREIQVIYNNDYHKKSKNTSKN